MHVHLIRLLLSSCHHWHVVSCWYVYIILILTHSKLIWNKPKRRFWCNTLKFNGLTFTWDVHGIPWLCKSLQISIFWTLLFAKWDFTVNKIRGDRLDGTGYVKFSVSLESSKIWYNFINTLQSTLVLGFCIFNFIIFIILTYSNRVS